MTLPEGAPVDLSFEQFTRRAELELQFIQALSQARLTDMKTASVEEHVVNQRLTNLTKSKSIDAFERDMTRFNANRREHEVEIRRLSGHAQNLNFYKLAHRLPGIVRQKVWAAFRVFLMAAPSSVLFGWSQRPFAIDRYPKPSETPWFDFKTVVNRAWNMPNDAEKKLLAASDVGALIDWQLDNHEYCSVVAGSPPHLATCLAFTELCDVAKADIATLEKSLTELRAGTFDLWKPQELIKLVDSPVT